MEFFLLQIREKELQIGSSLQHDPLRAARDREPGGKDPDHQHKAHHHRE